MKTTSCPGLASRWILEPASLSQNVTNEFREGARHGDVVLRHARRHRGLLRVHRGVAEHERPSREERAVEGLYQRRVQDDLGGQNSDVLDLEVGAERGSRRARSGVLIPQRSRRVRELDLYHQVQLRRQHLPAAQDAHHGGAQQHVRVAALHRAGPRVVHLVEALHGLVLVVLAALQQVMHGHGASDVVVALVGGVRVSDSEGDLDRLGVSGRQTLEVAGEKELSELGKYCTSCRAVT